MIIFLTYIGVFAGGVLTGFLFFALISANRDKAADDKGQIEYFYKCEEDKKFEREYELSAK